MSYRQQACAALLLFFGIFAAFGAFALAAAGGESIGLREPIVIALTMMLLAMAGAAAGGYACGKRREKP